MDFGFSDEQEMLRQTARDFLREHCPTTFVRRMMRMTRATPQRSGNTSLTSAGLAWLSPKPMVARDSVSST
jgi:alkylation response protein AidB-like acyl-CoA dehydrogenase